MNRLTEWIGQRLAGDPGKRQLLRYLSLALACAAMMAPLLWIPGLIGNDDLCGKLCMRRFFHVFPGMGWEDYRQIVIIAGIGAGLLAVIFAVTFFFGRLWCSHLCPAGGFPELVSRGLPGNLWKIDYRPLPQIAIRYGYFITFLLLMPAAGVSACSVCNFITVPRLFEAMAGDYRGVVFILSTIGIVNLALLFLLGFFAKHGRAYCQFLCPIGAVDALVNRLGAEFRFNRRIRVENSRCSGCGKCAEACMCGAIHMENRIARVDQLSCMSCRACVDVCEWAAIDHRPQVNDRPAKHKKKGGLFFPQGNWVVLPAKQRHDAAGSRSKTGWLLLLFTLLLSWLLLSDRAGAAVRQADPSGCLVCHRLPGLDFIDKNGVLRSASIDESHYLGSIHGTIPCRDCHQNIRDYPHAAENGAVDCSAACHVDEPSTKKAYTHEEIVEEHKNSAHGRGGYKGFTGGNRLEEHTGDPLPSCRRCHDNQLTISEEKMALFRETFNHSEKECGQCHRGKVWRNHFGGHIIRRLIGARWSKKKQVALCNGCHRDQTTMEKALENPKDTRDDAVEKARFLYASDSYQMTLHLRLLEKDQQRGAACLDCHAPMKNRHEVRRKGDPLATVHRDHLAKTCGTATCHGFGDHPLNAGFLTTDMHDLNYLPIDRHILAVNLLRFGGAPWLWAAGGFGFLTLMFFIWRTLRHPFQATADEGVPAMGGQWFRKKMLGKKTARKASP